MSADNFDSEQEPASDQVSLKMPQGVEVLADGELMGVPFPSRSGRERLVVIPRNKKDATLV